MTIWALPSDAVGRLPFGGISMIQIIALLKRKDGLSLDAFIDY